MDIGEDTYIFFMISINYDLVMKTTVQKMAFDWQRGVELIFHRFPIFGNGVHPIYYDLSLKLKI